MRGEGGWGCGEGDGMICYNIFVNVVSHQQMSISTKMLLHDHEGGWLVIGISHHQSTHS